MRPEENEKCKDCANRALKRTAYCILHCKNYDKFELKHPAVSNSKSLDQLEKEYKAHRRAHHP